MRVASTDTTGRPLVFQATRSLACVHFAQPDPLLSSWMSSSPAYTLQDFPVLADLASEHTAGPSLTQTPGNRNGGSAPANHAPTAASK